MSQCLHKWNFGNYRDRIDELLKIEILGKIFLLTYLSYSYKKVLQFSAAVQQEVDFH